MKKSDKVSIKSQGVRKRLLGAHLSTAGGLLKTLERAKQLQANCIQIFASNPRGWKGTAISEEASVLYRQHASSFGVDQLIIHAIYLVNLASPKKDVYENSIKALGRDLISAGRLGVKSLVVHPGSDLGDGRGVERLVKALNILETDRPKDCQILLEGMAGTKNSLGGFSTLAEIIQHLENPCGVCLDSAHLCATGYALGDSKDFERLIRDIKKSIGLASVGCIHINDSKQPCGSKRDNHENLGEGFVGRKGLMNMIHYKGFLKLPFIMETPGFNDLGPDTRNMKRLKSYCKIK